MRRRLVLAGLVSLTAVAGPALGTSPAARMPQPSAAPPAPQQVVLREGDTMLVEGTRLGCQVDRRQGRLTIECRRSGRRLAGTYMTALTGGDAMVARFASRRSAKVIFTARHGGRARVCPDASASRAPRAAPAAATCRPAG